MVDPLSEERQLALRTLELQNAARQLIREAHFDPGQMHVIPKEGGCRLAFGYRWTNEGGGRRQRYLVVELTTDEYSTLDDPVRQSVLGRLREQLGAPREALTAGVTHG